MNYHFHLTYYLKKQFVVIGFNVLWDFCIYKRLKALIELLLCCLTVFSWVQGTWSLGGK